MRSAKRLLLWSSRRSLGFRHQAREEAAVRSPGTGQGIGWRRRSWPGSSSGFLSVSAISWKERRSGGVSQAKRRMHCPAGNRWEDSWPPTYLGLGRTRATLRSP
jgi:hypothetical protein